MTPTPERDETRWYVEREGGIYIYEAAPLGREHGAIIEFRGPDFATEVEALNYALDCALDDRRRAQRDATTFRRRLRALTPKGSRGLHSGYRPTVKN